MPRLTREDIKNIKYIASLSDQWQEHELDLSDDRQWSFFMRQVARSGVSDKTHPEYMKSLRAARKEDQKRSGSAGRLKKRQKTLAAEDDSMQDANTISSFGISVAKTNSLGGGFSAIVNGTVFTSLYAQLIDLTNDSVLGEKSLGPVYGEGEYLPIDLTGTMPTKENMLMVLSWSYQPRTAEGAPSGPPIQGSMRVSTNELPVGAPVVTQPIRTVDTKNYIKIGLGRDEAHRPADCDYWYNEPNINDPNIRLPLVVTQKFKSNIKQPLWPSNITNPPTIFQIKLSTGGVTKPVSNDAIIAGITATGDTLSLNFPFNNDVTLDQSVKFGSAAWANDTSLLATISLGVKTDTSSNDFVWLNLYSSDTPPWATSPAPGEYQMYPNYYTWHCVAAGSKVLMAGGKTKKIEAIRGGDKVKLQNGVNFTVVDTFGTNKEADVLVVKTEAGHELLITDLHPVLTMTGLVAARDLLVGDKLMTDHGPSPVTSIKRKKYSGMVYSLGIGPTDAVTASTDETTCFFANGILIADSRLCVEFVRTYKKRLSTVLAGIPKKFHAEARRSYEKRYGHL
ncbi:MAG TPA: Hint domain-containing protein [Pyrinomonadaceae bacterium]|nr:Hint domain-containing protein [Pyrinomonadaceae bacterium]